MTLTAKEAMQALLDGKIVCQMDYDLEYTHMFKLSEKGWIVERFNDGWCASSYPPLNDIEDAIEDDIEKYPLTFEEALKAMLDGKVVESQRCNNPTRFHDGKFEYLCDDTWFFTDIQKFEQESKWKVVE